MYIIGAVTLEITDDQNESTTVNSSCVSIDEQSGTIITYPNVSREVKQINGQKQNIYTIEKKTPGTIYRNLKKIRIVSGEQVSWKYIRFK